MDILAAAIASTRAAEEAAVRPNTPQLFTPPTKNSNNNNNNNEISKAATTTTTTSNSNNNNTSAVNGNTDEDPALKDVTYCDVCLKERSRGKKYYVRESNFDSFEAVRAKLIQKAQTKYSEASNTHAQPIIEFPPLVVGRSIACVTCYNRTLTISKSMQNNNNNSSSSTNNHKRSLQLISAAGDAIPSLCSPRNANSNSNSNSSNTKDIDEQEDYDDIDGEHRVATMLIKRRRQIRRRNRFIQDDCDDDDDEQDATEEEDEDEDEDDDGSDDDYHPTSPARALPSAFSLSPALPSPSSLKASSPKVSASSSASSPSSSSKAPQTMTDFPCFFRRCHIGPSDRYLDLPEMKHIFRACSVHCKPTSSNLMGGSSTNTNTTNNNSSVPMVCCAACGERKLEQLIRGVYPYTICKDCKATVDKMCSYRNDSRVPDILRKRIKALYERWVEFEKQGGSKDGAANNPPSGQAQSQQPQKPLVKTPTKPFVQRTPYQQQQLKQQQREKLQRLHQQQQQLLQLEQSPPQPQPTKKLKLPPNTSLLSRLAGVPSSPSTSPSSSSTTSPKMAITNTIKLEPSSAASGQSSSLQARSPQQQQEQEQQQQEEDANRSPRPYSVLVFGADSPSSSLASFTPTTTPPQAPSSPCTIFGTANSKNGARLEFAPSQFMEVVQNLLQQGKQHTAAAATTTNLPATGLEVISVEGAHAAALLEQWYRAEQEINTVEQQRARITSLENACERLRQQLAETERQLREAQRLHPNIAEREQSLRQQLRAMHEVRAKCADVDQQLKNRLSASLWDIVKEQENDIETSMRRYNLSATRSHENRVRVLRNEVQKFHDELEQLLRASSRGDIRTLCQEVLEKVRDMLKQLPELPPPQEE